MYKPAEETKGIAVGDIEGEEGVREGAEELGGERVGDDADGDGRDLREAGGDVGRGVGRGLGVAGGRELDGRRDVERRGVEPRAAEARHAHALALGRVRRPARQHHRRQLPVALGVLPRDNLVVVAVALQNMHTADAPNSVTHLRFVPFFFFFPCSIKKGEKKHKKRREKLA